nr:Uncharacterised protein [Klebsiella pneumoniae]
MNFNLSRETCVSPTVHGGAGWRRVAPQRLFGTHRAPHQFAAAVRAMSVQSRRHAVPAKVHSNEQINASGESGGRSLSQHSQFGRNSSINFSSGERLYQRRRAKARYVYIMPRSVRREFPCAVIAFSEGRLPGLHSRYEDHFAARLFTFLKDLVARAPPPAAYGE